MKTVLTLFTCLGFISGCAVRHDNMNAVLWVQTSAEYQANAQMVFNVAASRLPGLKANPGLTADIDQADSFGCRVGTSCPGLSAAHLIAAVVLDMDETVLDNSVYQARLVKHGMNFHPDTWDDWVSEKAASPVPGALGFIERVKAEGISVIYLTNRSCSVRRDLKESSPGVPQLCPQRQDTEDNLIAAGFPALDSSDQLILRNERREWDASEKQARRQHIADRYRIVMLIGDDLGDFASNIKKSSVAERAQFVHDHRSLLGEFWFPLANPTYGSWHSVLMDNPKQGHLRLNPPD